MNKRRYTLELIREHIESIGYKLLSNEYKNNRTTVLKIQCNKGHIYNTVYRSFQSGSRCPICYGNKKLTYKFVKEQIEKEGYKLLSKKYINCRTKLKIECDKRHIYYVLYSSFQKGSRCPKCSKLKKHSNYDVKKEIKKYGFELLSEYRNMRTKIKVKCYKGHVSDVYLQGFRKRKNKCKYCNGYVVNNNKEKLKSNGYTKRNIPRYDTYAKKIDWCEEVRRNQEDNKILEVKCTYCGKWFIPTMKSVVHRISALYSDDGKENRLYCSNECKMECPIYLKKKYSAEENNTKRYSREVQPELRQLVFKGDKYKCQKCGSKKSLNCHHIEGVFQNPIESADIDNCITLCKKCHNKIHKQKGCRRIDLRSNC